MIVDSHTHLGLNSLSDAKVGELIKSLKKAKIDRALVFAGKIFGLTNEKLLELLSDYSGTLYPIGSISPLSPMISLKELEHLLKHNLIYGLKLYPGYEYFYPQDSWLKAYLELLVKYDKPLILHSGDTFNKYPKAKLKYARAIHVDDLATDLPHLKIIIAHVGYPWVIDAAEVCYKNKNVYADCSGFVYGKFTPSDKKRYKKIIDEFFSIAGSKEKLIFGTDWPISDQKSYVDTMQSIIVVKNEAFWHQTATKLFGLK